MFILKFKVKLKRRTEVVFLKSQYGTEVTSMCPRILSAPLCVLQVRLQTIAQEYIYNTLMLAVYGSWYWCRRCFSSSVFSVSCCSKSLITTLVFHPLPHSVGLMMSSAILVPDIFSAFLANLSTSASKLSQTLCSVFLFFFRTSSTHKRGRMRRVYSCGPLTATCYTAHLWAKPYERTLSHLNSVTYNQQTQHERRHLHRMDCAWPCRLACRLAEITSTMGIIFLFTRRNYWY